MTLPLLFYFPALNPTVIHTEGNDTWYIFLRLRSTDLPESKTLEQKQGRVTLVSAGLIWLEGFKREILALALGEDWNRSFTNFTNFLLIFTNFANTGKHIIEPEAQLLPKDK